MNNPRGVKTHSLTKRKRQDNITALLDLLDTRDFYSRLYSLQLMFQISSGRPERTQECILTAPLGIPRLVSVLGDAREPVRNGTFPFSICPVVPEFSADGRFTFLQKHYSSSLR